MKTRIEIKIKYLNIPFEDEIYTYQGINIDTGDVLFKNSFNGATEGMVEFVGAVHGLMYLKKENLSGDIYIERKFIKECIENKKYKYESKEPGSEKINEAIRRSLKWLVFEKEITNIYLI